MAEGRRETNGPEPMIVSHHPRTSTRWRARDTCASSWAASYQDPLNQDYHIYGRVGSCGLPLTRRLNALGVGWVRGHIGPQLVSRVQCATAPVFPPRPCAATAATRALDHRGRFDFMLRRECADFGHELFHIWYVGFFCYSCKVVLFDLFECAVIVLFCYD